MTAAAETCMVLISTSIALGLLTVCSAHAYRIIFSVNVKKIPHDHEEDATGLEKRLIAFQRERFGVPMDVLRTTLHPLRKKEEEHGTEERLTVRTRNVRNGR